MVFRNLLLIIGVLSLFMPAIFAQISDADRSGFTFINKEYVADDNYGSGYSFYTAAWPIFEQYPGPRDFQMGLAGCWLTTQRTGNEPEEFYTTIEGGLGWWHDTRFGTKVPKFIMGGVSYNFYAWANGPGAGRSNILPNGQRDWSQAGGKYGIAQLSNRLLWAPDGLNMAQSVNGERLGYGYRPLPITDPLAQTSGQDITTGNQCWTLFLNTSNFKGPATFFLPTFWTEPVLENPELEGLFLDSRPSDPNITFGLEHAQSPAIAATDVDGSLFAKALPLQYPKSDDNSSMLMSHVEVYHKDTLWNAMNNWFDGGEVVLPGQLRQGSYATPFINNGGSVLGDIKAQGDEFAMVLDYMGVKQHSSNIMGYEYELSKIKVKEDNFLMPTYFSLNSSNQWQAIQESEVPMSTGLLEESLPILPRPEISYLTPMEDDCLWQDPNGPWQSPGPTSGPYYAELGDGSTLTYYWYRFVDQPAIVHAGYSDEMRENMQSRVERIHQHWKHTDEYMAAPEIGQLAALDPEAIVTPPEGLEIGYVPIVTRQEKSKKKLRVFVLAGQSNMQGYGDINSEKPGSLNTVLNNDTEGTWSYISTDGEWNTLDGAYIYSDRQFDIIKGKVSVGQGAESEFIGPELSFAHMLDEYYDDPILIIKTAWGGKSLAVDFRPPSATGDTGAFYTEMIQSIDQVTQNLSTEFPDLEVEDHEIMGLAWFQGWNDGAEETYLEEYESNLKLFMEDVRRDLGQDQLPIIIASAGQGGYEISSDSWVRSMQERVSLAQENVGCDDDTYGGRVGFVDSKKFYYPADQSPENAIHHYNGNALTYLQVGKSLGEEMILAINDMAYCYNDCDAQVDPGVVSIGNRVWNDLNRNGIDDNGEPGIPGVSLVLWSDPDGDGIPDWQGFSGVQVTDENGYYQFNGLEAGNYIVFVWQVDNWEEGNPLHGYQSTIDYVADADNDEDFDNNGSGLPFTDIKSGIITLSIGEEPLDDGDIFSCYFDYDASGNNTIDFGFYNPNDTITSTIDKEVVELVNIYPNPAQSMVYVESAINVKLQFRNLVGQLVYRTSSTKENKGIDLSDLSNGIYWIEILNDHNEVLKIEKLIKVD